jgi:hypothetical protein
MNSDPVVPDDALERADRMLSAHVGMRIVTIDRAWGTRETTIRERVRGSFGSARWFSTNGYWLSADGSPIGGVTWKPID